MYIYLSSFKYRNIGWSEPIQDTIIRKLREAEILQGQGKAIAQAVKQLGVTEQTFYRWRNERNYGNRPNGCLN